MNFISYSVQGNQCLYIVELRLLIFNVIERNVGFLSFVFLLLFCITISLVLWWFELETFVQVDQEVWPYWRRCVTGWYLRFKRIPTILSVPFSLLLVGQDVNSHFFLPPSTILYSNPLKL